MEYNKQEAAVLPESTDDDGDKSRLKLAKKRFSNRRRLNQSEDQADKELNRSEDSEPQKKLVRPILKQSSENLIYGSLVIRKTRSVPKRAESHCNI